MQTNPNLRIKNLPKLLEAALMNSLDAIAASVAGIHVFVNPAYVKLFGYESEEEILGTPIIDLIGTSSRAMIQQYVSDRAAGREVPARYELMLLRKDGKEFPAENNVSAFEFEGTQYTLPCFRDLTLQRSAQETLANTLSDFEDLYNNAPCGYHSLNSEGHLIAINDTELNWLGYSRAEVLGKPMVGLLGGDGRNIFKKIFCQNVKGTPTLDLPISLRRKDGSEFPVLLNNSILADEQGNFVKTRSIVTDLTERQKHQDQLTVTSKLASIGLLAAGVAHEINNPLTVVLGHVELLLRTFTAGDTLDPTDTIKRLEKMQSASKRIAGIINGLQHFARHDASVPTRTSLNEVVTETTQFLENFLNKAGIRTEIALDPHGAWIWSQSGKLEQVLINLVINARDALEDISHGLIKIETASDEKMCTLKISDNGCGIPVENRKNLFDPFFTTKAVGKGTGLGLSISKSIIQTLKGSMALESEVGIGTTFTLQLPSAALVSKDQSCRQESALKSAFRLTGRVLIVDDESEILELINGDLKNTGMEAVRTQSGEGALALLRNQRFDFVILDIKMTDMSGDEVLEKAQNLNLINTKFLIITGGILTEYTEAARLRIGKFAHGFLRKPFDKEALFKEMERVSEKK